MHPIENIMQTAMVEIKDMIDVNTIIGDPIISTDGSTIIPVSKVAFGFVAGGGEYGKTDGQQDAQHPFAGGASSGISICPIGFLVVNESDVQLLPVNGSNLLEKLFETVPKIVSHVKEAFKGKDEKGE
jgi:sporulation protein YtfJ